MGQRRHGSGMETVSSRLNRLMSPGVIERDNPEVYWNEIFLLAKDINVADELEVYWNNRCYMLIFDNLEMFLDNVCGFNQLLREYYNDEIPTNVIKKITLPGKYLSENVECTANLSCIRNPNSITIVIEFFKYNSKRNSSYNQIDFPFEDGDNIITCELSFDDVYNLINNLNEHMQLLCDANDYDNDDINPWDLNPTTIFSNF